MKNESRIVSRAMCKHRVIAASLALALLAAPALAQTLPLAGNWECNHTKVSIHTKDNWRISIEQTGNDLTLIDGTGRRVAGNFVPPDTVAASGWAHGTEGVVGIGVDGKFYAMADAKREFGARLGSEVRWNFVRWSDGTVCFKKRD